MKRLKKFFTFLVMIFCVSFLLMLMIFPSLFSAGVRKGLTLCAETMIPSMFPFFVLSSFMTRSGMIDLIGRKTDGIFKKIFALSGKSGSVFLLSLFSGFPVGAKTVSSLLDRKEISENEAQRLMLCSVNAGPAFTVSAVGAAMMSSKKAGIIIFFSLSVSSVIICFLSRFIIEKDLTFLPVCNKNSYENFSSSLINSVSDSTVSMLSVSGWIVLFSCICSVAESIEFFEKNSLLFRSVFEVSIGCEEAGGQGNIPLVTAVIGWSGLCVHCQVFSAVIKSKMKKRLFFISKILHSALSMVVCDLLLKVFPCSVSVFANSASAVESFYSSAPAAAGLLLMGAILISDLETSRKVC